MSILGNLQPKRFLGKILWTDWTTVWACQRRIQASPSKMLKRKRKCAWKHLTTIFNLLFERHERAVRLKINKGLMDICWNYLIRPWNQREFGNIDGYWFQVSTPMGANFGIFEEVEISFKHIDSKSLLKNLHISTSSKIPKLAPMPAVVVQ